MIVFNLVPLIQHTWTVDIWIASTNATGQPGYLTSKITPENFHSFFPNEKGTDLHALVDKCDTLSFKSLETYLNRNNKKKISLQLFFEDPKQKKWVSEYADKRLADILHLLQSQSRTLLFNHKKNDHIDQSSFIQWKDNLTPVIVIKKTAIGMNYNLSLKNDEGKSYKLSQCKATILTNVMSKINIDNQLFGVDYINGNKLRPFLTNDFVYIKNELSAQFFNTFLVDLTSKVPIEAEGFDVTHYTQLDEVSLKVYEDISEKRWMVSVAFRYSDYSFQYGSNAKMQSKIRHANDQWNVTQIERNSDEELRVISSIVALGLKENFNAKFYYRDGHLDIFEFLNENAHKFNEKITVVLPSIEGKKIVCSPIVLTTNFSLNGDWFDLVGTIEIGEYKFPISKLFHHIRKQNRYFALAEDTVIILPEYLFSTYESILLHATPSSIYKLAKHHHALIPPALIAPRVNTLAKPTFVAPEGLNATLRPYQMEGVEWLIQHRNQNLGVLLADDMGLGKTLQTLTLLLDTKLRAAENVSSQTQARQLDLFQPVLHDRKPLGALVVLPMSLIYNWKSEIYKYTPSLQSVIFLGDKRERLKATLLQFDIILTTYQTLYREVDWLEQGSFTYLILDESQYIKNRDSQIFSAVSRIRTKHKLSLSGTPIENSLDDLWSQMQIINPDILGEYSFFKKHYKLPIEKDNNQKALDTLKQIVQPYILRRTKQQVAPDLPELIQQYLYCEMPDDHQRIYKEEASKIRNHLLGLIKNQQYRIHVFSALMTLRQMANHPKIIDATYEGLSGKLEEMLQVAKPILKNKNKILFFSSFEKHLHIAAEGLQALGFNVLTVTGETPLEQRTAKVNQFQNDENSNLLGMTLKTGGVGLNITRADYVFILDPWWNPFSEMQAVARAHRIGRTSSVIVYRFITKDSIEEKIVSLQNQKQALASNFIDIPDHTPLTLEDMESLLQ